MKIYKVIQDGEVINVFLSSTKAYTRAEQLTKRLRKCGFTALSQTVRVSTCDEVQ